VIVILPKIVLPLSLAYLHPVPLVQWISGVNVDIYRKDCPYPRLVVLADGEFFHYLFSVIHCFFDLTQKSNLAN
jgi:hypothetical protein